MLTSTAIVRLLRTGLAGALCCAALPAARGHEGAATRPAAATPAGAEQTPWGISGAGRRIDRVLRIDMQDSMRFVPDRIVVGLGETVRLEVRNGGRVLHELVLGTEESLAEHAALMRRFPSMEHDEPHMAHVRPGRRAAIDWTFNRAGTFGFACLVGGHFEAGMRGTVEVTDRPPLTKGKAR